MTEPYQRNDLEYVRAQYRTQNNLATRIDTHRRYGEPTVEFTEWVLEKIPWQGDEWVLDVGCGAGVYAAPVQARAAHYVAGDLSAGMLRALPPTTRLRVNLDARYLPLVDDTFDVVLAAHMLYHVPDQAAAVAGMRRVLRPGGRLLATTNSEESMTELNALQQEAATRLGLPTLAEGRPPLAFNLENGHALLSRFFDHVERHDLPGSLVFPTPQPVIDYLASSRERYQRALPPEVTWADVEGALAATLTEKIAAAGEFRVNKLTGLFICWNGTRD